MSALKFFIAIFLGVVCMESCFSAEGDEVEKSKVKQRPSNFPFMIRGYCFAGSKIKDAKALGGFGSSTNFPKAIDNTIAAPKDEIYLLAQPEAEVAFQSKYKGMKVLLINGTEKQHSFPASDSRVAIVQEAKDTDGTWKPVEYLSSSFCGNSYHSVSLPTKEYWQFIAPKYEGSQETTLRFSFKVSKDNVLYSNEFKGSVNPKQFSVRQGRQKLEPLKSETKEEDAEKEKSTPAK